MSKNQEKAEKMRESYDKTAAVYDSRYSLIQYIKYTILLEKIIQIKKRKDTIMLKLPSLLLDYGGGSLLFIDFLTAFNEFLLHSELIKEKDLALSECNNDQMALFSYLISCLREDHLFNKRIDKINVEFVIPQTVIIDISYKMLKVGLEKIENNQGKIYGCIACDGQHLPFRKKIFKSIVSFTAIQNLSDIKRGIREISRIATKNPLVGLSILKKKIDPSDFKEIFISEFQNIEDLVIDDKYIFNLNNFIESLNPEFKMIYNSRIRTLIEKNEDFFIWSINKNINIYL
ncbi:MAG: methyltransferase domain-containing protein [Candidatus Lokiarchaeota archaeon]|nr:methyltransferase domain-containing protein [Candidatus Lokiarchaeota archaeon]